MPQRSIPAVWMRGGTSKGLLVREEHLPPSGPERDAVVLEIMGSPDIAQIDGMGGGMSSTSKIIAVSPSERPGVAAEFLFGQVAVRDAIVDWKPNSGNLTAAVCAYVVDEGLVEVSGDEAVFVLYNQNTRNEIRATVPVVNGRAAVQGDVQVAGVPRPGAGIFNEYLNPTGSFLGRGPLPTGRAVDVLATAVGEFEVSFVDGANLMMFVEAAALGIDGSVLPDTVNGDNALLTRIETVRSAGALHLGLIGPGETAAAKSPILPLISLLSPPADYSTAQSGRVSAKDVDFLARPFSLQRMHHAHPLSGLICTAIAGTAEGTVAQRLRGDRPDNWVRVGHSKGVAAAEVRFFANGTVESVAAVRTARRLMAGEVYVRT